MIELSGRLASLGLPTTINSPSDLSRIMQAVATTISDLKLWQYYVLDVNSERDRVAAAASSPKQWGGENVAGKSVEQLAQVAIHSGIIQGYRSLAGRFVTKVDPEVAAGLVRAAQPNETDVAGLWARVVDVINVDLYRECDDDLKAAREGIEGRLKYTRLDSHGPRMGEISTK
jgi:glycogen debranching enzyme